MRKAKGIALAATTGMLAAAFIAASAPSSTAATAGTAGTNPSVTTGKQAPAKVVKPGVIEFTKGLATLPNTEQCRMLIGIACYWPSQLQGTYDEGPLFRAGIEGRGETIVIVDSFGSPTIANDLKVFDAQWHLPAPPSLKIITPAGKPPAWNPNDTDMTGWGTETSLDVEYAHVIAPLANILLVETPTSETEGVAGFPQIVQAEDFVVAHNLGDVISQSFGATEQTFPDGLATLNANHLRQAYEGARRHNITVLGASGDAGATDFQADGTDYYAMPVTSWPASDPDVTAVGGTQIKQGGNHTYYSVAWNDTFNVNVTGSTPTPAASGGGLSTFFATPSYQAGDPVAAAAVGTARGVPDISMSGACNGAVLVYMSFPEQGSGAGWFPICGTSEATPEFAGIVALADEVAGHPLGLINPTLYALAAAGAPGIVPVTRGNNTVQFTASGATTPTTVTGFNAQAGYSLVDGVGTVNAADLVYELAGKPVP